jgi:hypothetical protein
MDFRAALSLALPPPRDDEPAGLRQDILDELADHLVSSYHRELLRGLDPATARARVTEEFGDPAAVARRLWLDAMKGKIMAQRVLIAACLVVTIASLSLAGLLWLRSTQSAVQLARAEQRMAESMAEARTTNQEMLRQLQVMAQASQPAQSAQWIPVTFKLTLESAGGPPAAGYNVFLGRGHNGSGRPGSMHRESDEHGQADFGVIEPGDWEFRITRLADDGHAWSATGYINVLPGAKIAKSVVCPAEYSENMPVRLRVDWPTDLADQQIHTAAQFGFTGITYEPPLRWQMGQPAPGAISSLRDVLCRPGGKLSEIVDASHFFLWRLVGEKNDLDGPVFADLPSDSVSSPGDTVRFAAGEYRLLRLIVLRPVAGPKKPEFPVERFDFIAQAARTQAQGAFLKFIFRMEIAPSRKMDPSQQGGFGNYEQDNYSVFSSSFRGLTKGRFEARAGQAGEWLIPLPDELLKVVRAKLKPRASTGTN